MFWDGEVANISFSPDKAKAMKFLEDAVMKTLKKPVLKVARKGKAPTEEVLEDTSVGGANGSWVTFGDGLDTSRGSMKYVDGMDEEANSDSSKEGTDFVVVVGNSSSYELEAYIVFLLSCHLFEEYPHKKILGRHFP